MSAHYCTMFPKFSDLISDQILYKELVNSECLPKDDQNCDDNFYDLNELEEVFADHLLMGKRLQKTLYGGNLENFDDEDCEHPPIALTDLALKLFSKAVPNYGLDLLDMDYVSSVTEATRVSPCAMILALIYLERLQLKNSDYLESVSPSGLFVVTMLVASKFLFENEDDIVTNQIWADALNLDVKEINRIEQKFLSAIDWRLYVDSSEYFQYLSNVEKTIAVKQSSVRGWLSYSDASTILQDPVIRKFFLSCLERILKVSALSVLGYTMTVLSLCVAGVTIYCRSSENVCLSTEEDFSLESNLRLQRSISGLSNIELNSGTKLPVDKSSDAEAIWKELSLNDRHSDTYESKDLSYVLDKQLDNLSYDPEKHSPVICSKATSSSSSTPQPLKLKSVYNTYLSNSSFQNKIIVNHTLYRLYLEPTIFKNVCISVSVK